MRSRRRRLAVCALGGLLLVLAGCGSDTKSKDEAAIRGVIAGVVRADRAKDGPAFASYFTDNGLKAQDIGTREEIVSGKSSLGEDPPEAYTVSSIVITGDTAQAVLDVTSGVGIFRLKVPFVRQAERWLVDGLEFLGSPPPPQGTDVMDVKAVDYGFTLTPAEIPSGTFALKFRNTGKEQHEITMFRLPEGVTREEAREALENVDGGSLDNVPRPYELVDHITFAEPGASVDFLFAKAVDSGRYAFACYIPQGGFGEEGPVNPKGKPHIQLGMFADFTVT